MTFEDYKATQSDLVSGLVNGRHNALCDALDGLPLPVESGSNSNGSWLKLANGVLVQWGTKSQNVAITNQSGSIYYSANDFIVTYPIAFDATPIMIPSNHTTNSWWTTTPHKTSAGSASSVGIGFTAQTSIASANEVVSWVAIGTWS